MNLIAGSNDLCTNSVVVTVVLVYRVVQSVMAAETTLVPILTTIHVTKDIFCNIRMMILLELYLMGIYLAAV